MARWLVTGCSTGIGREIARAALDAGHSVVVTARRVEAAIEATTAAGHLTRDIGGTADTNEITEAIIEALAKSLTSA